nr:immunoglobulin heavy chain junction region [Macaca mulatta]
CAKDAGSAWSEIGYFEYW